LCAASFPNKIARRIVIENEPQLCLCVASFSYEIVIKTVIENEPQMCLDVSLPFLMRL